VSYDVTDSYGMESIPADYKLPKFTLDYTRDYKFTDLTPATLKKVIKEGMEKEDVQTTLNYLSDKVGFNHSDPKMYK